MKPTILREIARATVAQVAAAQGKTKAVSYCVMVTASLADGRSIVLTGHRGLYPKPRRDRRGLGALEAMISAGAEPGAGE